MKAKRANEATKLEEIPNIGPRIAQDLRKIGIKVPRDLAGKDGIDLYLKLIKVTGQRHDPCVADTFMAAVDFMNGGKVKTWWQFTKKRKEIFKSKGIK